MQESPAGVHFECTACVCVCFPPLPSCFLQGLREMGRRAHGFRRVPVWHLHCAGWKHPCRAAQPAFRTVWILTVGHKSKGPLCISQHPAHRGFRRLGNNETGSNRVSHTDCLKLLWTIFSFSFPEALGSQDSNILLLQLHHGLSRKKKHKGIVGKMRVPCRVGKEVF